LALEPDDELQIKLAHDWLTRRNSLASSTASPHVRLTAGKVEDYAFVGVGLISLVVIHTCAKSNNSCL
jgi:hypothetical protein